MTNARTSTLATVLAAARKRLEAAGVDDANIEAEVLLRFALGPARPDVLEGRVTRAGLYARLQDDIEPETAARFDSLVARRLAHEPSAYITGDREFFGLDFYVTPAVLIPRPETETLVDVAIDLLQDRAAPDIADVGTGSGIVAVCLALGLPDAQVLAIDASSEALAVAAVNAERHGVADRITFLEGDLLEPAPSDLDLIAANLPYVRSSDIEALAPEVRDYEPRGALDGGPDGLDLIRRLLEAAHEHLRPGGAVCLEFGDLQADALLSLAGWRIPGSMPRIDIDFAGRPRVLSAVYRPEAAG